MEVFGLCTSCASAEFCKEAMRAHLNEGGYEITLDVSLATLPGSVHFHIKKVGETSGTLEFTMHPTKGRVWLSYHDNRFKDWIPQAIRYAESFPGTCRMGSND